MNEQVPVRTSLWQFGLIRFVFFVAVWSGAMYVLRDKEQAFNFEQTVMLGVLGGALFGGARAWMEARRRKLEDEAGS